MNEIKAVRTVKELIGALEHLHPDCLVQVMVTEADGDVIRFIADLEWVNDDPLYSNEIDDDYLKGEEVKLVYLECAEI